MVDFGFFALFFVAAMVLSLVHLVGQVLAVVDMVGRQDAQVLGDSRLLWVLIAIFLPFGWLVYFVVGRR